MRLEVLEYQKGSVNASRGRDVELTRDGRQDVFFFRSTRVKQQDASRFRAADILLVTWIKQPKSFNVIRL